MNSERLYSAQARSSRTQSKAAEETVRSFVTALQFKAKHATETRHLPLGEIVLWMALEPRVVNSFHSRMFLESLCKVEGILVVLTYPESQRAQTAQRKPGVKWSQRSAKDDMRVPYFRDPLLAAHHDSRDEIRMSAEIFRRTVKDQVDAKIDWTLIERRGKGVVNQRCNSVRLGNCHDRSQSGECHQRIAWCFHEDKFRIGPQCFLKSGRITLVYLRNLDAKSGHQFLQEIRSATIVVGLRNHVVALAYDREHGCTHGSHARSGHQRGFGAFECGEYALHLTQSRIPITGVKLGMSSFARAFSEVFA